MKGFKVWLGESLLNEVLDSSFHINRHEDVKNAINNASNGRLAIGHTAVMSSDHMDKHKLKVLRIKNNNSGDIEYHIMHNDNKLGKLPVKERDTKAFLHALKIINDDSKSYVERGDKIKLQSHDSHQHNLYKRLADRLVKQYPDKKVNNIGKQERIDGGGLADTLMIESDTDGVVNWSQFINGVLC